MKFTEIVLLILMTTMWILATVSPSNAQSGPMLLYASAKAGPNHGWENSATKGAAITVWGKNLGSSRGTNTLTCAGVTLSTAGDFAEWGATTNPTTAKGFQRITFWLNSSMPNGSTAGIYVTVDGVNSNTLAFTIDNTAYQRIRFVDTANGSESYNGQYATHTSGSNGPWKYPFATSARDGVAPGAFIYMRAGTYTNIQESGWHAPRGGCIGAAEAGSGGCNWYYSQINGTDPLRITITSYPGEHAHLFNAYVESFSNYWTFANFTFDGDLTYAPSGNIYMAMTIGMEDGYCTSCTVHTVGNQVIGLSLIHNMHIGIQMWGSGSILATYIYNYPTDAGLGIGHDYNLYIGSSDGITIKDNELHGGSRYNIQAYDETRNCVPLYSDTGRGISNLTIDSNLIDMNLSSVTPYTKYYGVLLGMAWSGGVLNNIVIKNNVFYLNDGSYHTDLSAVNIYQEAATVTMNGFYFYNNTVYGLENGIDTMQASSTTASNIDIRNNIFSNITAYHWTTQSAGRLVPTWSYNLTDKALSFNGSVTNNGHNVVADPLFISTAAPNFHLQSTSPAKDVGVAIASVTKDYDNVLRPQGSAYDIGAYEYSAGGGGNTPPAAPTNLRIVSP
jgi:hypothetical protein